jgi:hypothetical protein
MPSHRRLFTATTALAALALCGTTSCSKPKTDAPAGQEGNPAAGGSVSAGAGAGAGGVAMPSLSVLTSGFEGEIDAFMQKAGGPQTPVSVYLKGDKVRFDVPEEMGKHGGQFFGEKAFGIYDSAAKKVFIVSDAKKQAIVIDMNTGKPMTFGQPGGQHTLGAPDPSRPPSKVTKTGKYDTVAGLKCEVWELTSDHKEGTICVSEQGVSWLSLPTTAIPGEHAWMTELVDGKHFPLRFVSYAKDGTTEEQRVEVTKLDKKSMADSQFAVPPGYNVLDIDKMMAGMPGMMPLGMPSGIPGMPPGMSPGAFSGRMPRPMPPH